jgi:hypothetical protein
MNKKAVALILIATSLLSVGYSQTNLNFTGISSTFEGEATFFL